MRTDLEYETSDMALFKECILCPRECHVNRFEGNEGYCKMDAGLNIASICIHKGEEPSISGPDGICNVFFGGCNLHCIFCQNYEISQPGAGCCKSKKSLPDVLDKIEEILSKGIRSVGFVSPSHAVPQVKAIIRGLNNRGLKPITVYNTNSYDKPETLRSIAGMIDIYLPDYKYVTPALAREYSDAYNYPEVAFAAIKEMYFQKGSVLHLDDKGQAESGIILRHLVLPGHVEESKKLLRKIAEDLSTGIHLSLMSQYHPVTHVKNYHPLNRALYKPEYEAVVEAMEGLGFRNGWVQDMDSFQNYLPDFSKEHPFE